MIPEGTGAPCTATNAAPSEPHVTLGRRARHNPAGTRRAPLRLQVGHDLKTRREVRNNGI